MADVKKLIMAFVKFLVQQLESGNLSPDAKESVEVAVQCLETAYGVDRNDSTCGVAPRSLLSMFSENAGKDQIQEQKTSEEDKIEAERLKNEGNVLMKAEKYREAINAYSSAISLDKNNAVYYCNRAAAHSKLSDFCSAVEDCRQAIIIDPNYSKAYGRMGLACASMDDDETAINCYRKACELEPSNESYRTNLQMAESKMGRKYSHTSQSSSSHESSLNSPVDIGSLLGNPTLVSMATQLMQDPSMQNLMAGFMSNSISQNQPENSGMEALLRAGQQLATQMQQANPELVASLRQQLGTHESPSSENKGDSSQQH